jgi:hypothetical protein
MKRSQSMLEYSILLIIIIAAIMSMQVYVKRGFQGRWKQSVDDLGEQYDANGYTSNMRYTLNTVSSSSLRVKPEQRGGVNGLATYRDDFSDSVEKKEGCSVMAPAGL